MFQMTPRAEALKAKLETFMDEHVYPNEMRVHEEHARLGSRWATPRIVEDLKARAREQGLWNLFMPHAEYGPGLGHLDYAFLCEVMGRSPIAPELFNCNAPDTGNMETLALYGSGEQKERWLKPLLEGTIRSAFAMTEPAVASSDATNIACSIRREGDGYVIDGRKWWITNALDERCQLFIVMGKTDPGAPRHRQQSMILVPRETPGVRVERALSVFGYEHAPSGHGEVVFEGVRVPAENLLAGEGRGFEIAQARLGPGRIHHCMRFIGAAERALELTCSRAGARVAFGRPLAEQGAIRQAIGRSRCEIEQARLLTLKAAWMMDTVGPKAARAEIAMIKVVAPAMACAVIDRAMQVHGAAGLSQDFFLAEAYAWARAIRLGDGPDEVHLEALARRELKRAE